jgi:hypothetical protein
MSPPNPKPGGPYLERGANLGRYGMGFTNNRRGRLLTGLVY